jgi:hypothetical protein
MRAQLIGTVHTDDVTPNGRRGGHPGAEYWPRRRDAPRWLSLRPIMGHTAMRLAAAELRIDFNALP